MSAIIFGKCVFNKMLTEKEINELSWVVLNLGVGQKIYFQMEYNFVKSIFFEELDEENYTFTGWDLGFCITDSPFYNISEELLCPSPDLFFQSLRKIFEKICRVITQILKLEQVKEVIMYITEGYGDFGDPIVLTVENFVDKCIESYKNTGTVPSVKFIINK